MPASRVVMPSKPRRGEQEGGFIIVSRIPVVSGTDIRSADPGNKSDTNEPIVNVINSILGPVMLLVRKNLSASSAVASGDASIDTYLARDGQTLGGLVQTTFAQLQQSNPAAAMLYRDHKLWEDMGADALLAAVRSTPCCPSWPNRLYERLLSRSEHELERALNS